MEQTNSCDNNIETAFIKCSKKYGERFTVKQYKKFIKNTKYK